MPARRPGRVQRIAHDATPLNTASPDIESRIGWLLAMSRLHHRDAEVGDGKRFVAALADAGVSASRSLVSRWESGEIPISYEGMAGYERVLGLHPGRITSITGYIRAALPGVPTRIARPALDPTSTAFADRLDALLDLVDAGKGVGADWQELGWHLARAPHVHLRPDTWESLARRIVDVQPRAVKVPYRQYSVAAMNLADQPRAQHFLTEAVADYLAHPDVQVMMNPIGLLDRLPTREAAALVLNLVEHPPNEPARRLAIWVAAQKVASGGFTAEERSRLDLIVLRLWRANPEKAANELAELVAILPEGIRSTLAQAEQRAGRRRLGYAIEHAEDVPAARATEMSTEIADRARERTPQEPAYAADPMLARLVREAICHRDSERRHLANLLISASPFCEAVTDELLLRLRDTELPSRFRGRLAVSVRYTSEEMHRMRMLPFLEDPDDDVAIPIAQGIGHLHVSDLSDHAVRSSLRDDWSMRERAKLYALGMSGSPALTSLQRSRTAPEWQRAAARWWTQVGTARMV